MFIHLIFSALYIITSYKTVSADEDMKLILVQMLYRHGDRAPISLYPNDPNPESIWPEGLGALTLLGKRQHYNLGKYLRDFYKDFKTTSPLEVNVTSSDDERCLKSAEANLASFYAPQKPWKFDENFDWQPISIRYLPKKADKYLQTTSDCPRAAAEEQRVVNSPEGKEFNAKHQEMYDYLEKYSGEPITGWKPAAFLRDNIWIEMRYNLTVPSWVMPYWNELTFVKDSAFYWIFNSPLLQRLRVGPLLQRIIRTMENKIEGGIPNLKFQIFSAHDTNIAALLMALNLFDMKQPPYCATILVELYSRLNGSYFVRLLYLNSTEIDKITQTPHILKLDGCSEFCPLQYFKEYTKHLIPDDWEKECELPESNIQKFENEEIRLGIVFLAVIFIISTVIRLILYPCQPFEMFQKGRKHTLQETNRVFKTLC